MISLLTTQVVYFDFYTTTGVKLEIATRSFDDPRVFDYSGEESEVMVVPKDINYVSGFEKGLSDIESLWYKQSVNRSTRRAVTSDSTLTPAEEVKKILDVIIDNDEVNTNPYLLGWKVSLQYNENDQFPELGNEDALNYLESEIMEKQKIVEEHFTKTTMKKETRRFLDGQQYLFFIGDGRYEKDDNGDYRLNLKVGEFDVLVIAKREAVKRSITLSDGKPVVTTLLIHGSSVIFTSNSKKTLKGSVKYLDKSANGTLELERLGPLPKDVKSQEKITYGTFRFDAKLPFGAYKVDYKNSCACPYAIDDEYIFNQNYQETAFLLPPHESLADVSLKLVDSKDEAVKNAKVELKSKACVESETQEIFIGKTNSDGLVHFEAVTIGDYDVYVNDVINTEIHFCADHTATLHAEPASMWDINITFHGRFTNYEKSYKNIKIAGKDDTLTDESVWKLGLYPFPYADEYVGGIVLAETSYFDEAYGENRLSYYANGYGDGLIKPGYCFFTDELNELIEDQGDSGIGCWDESYTPTWDQIDTSFNADQEASFLLHEAFNIEDTGRWINDGGSSSIKITFTPVK